MQATSHEGEPRPFPTLAFSSSGLFESTHRIAWCRRDWRAAVGFLDAFTQTRYTSAVAGDSYAWTLCKIPSLLLSHTATLLLLGGTQLKHILIPNYYVRVRSSSDVDLDAVWGTVVLRVDPWVYSKVTPELTNLVIGNFQGAPDEVVQQLLLPQAVSVSADA